MRRRCPIVFLSAMVAIAPVAAATEAPAPLRSAELVDSFGVNIHMAYTDTAYTDVTKVRQALTYTGLRHLRNLVLTGAIDPAGLTHLNQLAADSNYRIDFVANDPDLTRVMKWLEVFAARFPGVIAAIEGPNEVDNWPIGYAGKTGRGAALDYQRDLYQAVRHDTAFAKVPVYALTGLGSSWSGDLSAIMDDANEHPYARNGMPPSAHLLKEIAQTHQALAPSRPMVVTETGYPTLLNHPEISFGKDGISQELQASYSLDLLLDFKKAGVGRTYLYELLDEKPDPDGRAIDQHYGLFSFDGSPKKSAHALHNLSAILRDDGSEAARFAIKPLRASIEGLPENGNSLTVQKSDGTTQIIVWAEPHVWDAASSTAAAAPPCEVTVSFGQPIKEITTYDPLVGSSGLTTINHTDRVKIVVTDHPLIIEAKPDGS